MEKFIGEDIPVMKMWHNAEKRILFLMKDTNDNANQDSREWIGQQTEHLITHKFFKNIALWLTGISSFKNDGSYIHLQGILLKMYILERWRHTKNLY